jgi:hypothetical protein
MWTKMGHIVTFQIKIYCYDMMESGKARRLIKSSCQRDLKECYYK